jgi:hypothetical protein
MKPGIDARPGRSARKSREARSPVVLTCELRVGSGAWRRASLLDLSSDGLRLAWLPGCSVGGEIWVRLPGLEARQAAIRWCDREAIGCQFVRPLHAAVVDFLSRATVRPRA